MFWKERLNFNHGTGHGVGYLLNIHEPPINFRWKEGKNAAPALQKNMIITDEPGIYRAGRHGVRILPEKMSDEEKKMLNEYHAAVYEKVGMYLEENEREWLKRYTRPI